MIREMTSIRLERDGNFEIHDRQQFELLLTEELRMPKWKSYVECWGRVLSNEMQSLRSRGNGF